MPNYRIGYTNKANDYDFTKFIRLEDDHPLFITARNTEIRSNMKNRGLSGDHYSDWHVNLDK